MAGYLAHEMVWLPEGFMSLKREVERTRGKGIELRVGTVVSLAKSEAGMSVRESVQAHTPALTEPSAAPHSRARRNALRA